MFLTVGGEFSAYISSTPTHFYTHSLVDKLEGLLEFFFCSSLRVWGISDRLPINQSLYCIDRVLQDSVQCWCGGYLIDCKLQPHQ